MYRIAFLWTKSPKNSIMLREDVIHDVISDNSFDTDFHRGGVVSGCAYICGEGVCGVSRYGDDARSELE